MKKILTTFICIIILLPTSIFGGTQHAGSTSNFSVNGSSITKHNEKNTPPTAMNIYFKTPAGSTIDSKLSGFDGDNADNLLFTLSTPPVNGSVNINSETGEFIYTAGQKAGKDYFEYYASDSNAKSNIAKVTIIISESESVPSGKYIDLWEHWAEEAALYLTENDVLAGEEVDGEFYFYPNQKMTRGEFIVWANSAFGYEGSTNDNTLPFEDTQRAEKWIAKAASGAYHNNLITGSEINGKLYFNPNDNLTRVEAFTILYNVLRPASADDTTLEFVDSETFPLWSIKALKAMKNTGILNGYDDNTLRVYNTVSRGEAAKLLHKTLLNLQGKSKTIERLK